MSLSLTGELYGEPGPNQLRKPYKARRKQRWALGQQANTKISLITTYKYKKETRIYTKDKGMRIQQSKKTCKRTKGGGNEAHRPEQSERSAPPKAGVLV
jgi:hypothetical protein